MAATDKEAAMRVLEIALDKITGDCTESRLNRLGRAVLEPLASFKHWSETSLVRNSPDLEAAQRAVQMATLPAPHHGLDRAYNEVTMFDRKHFDDARKRRLDAKHFHSLPGGVFKRQKLARGKTVSFECKKSAIEAWENGTDPRMRGSGQHSKVCFSRKF